MSENKVQRLSKVAKELNVSISTITEFLKGKGHKIENNPMAKITDDVYLLLSKEYQSEKAAKEEAKQVTSVARDKKESISLDENAKKPEAKKKEEEEDIIIKNVPTSASEEKAKPSKKTAVVKDEPEKEKIKSDVKLTVVSKIDLDALNSKTKPAKKSKEEKEEDKKEKTAKGKGKTKKETKEEIIEKLPVSEAPTETVNAPAQEDFFETKIEKLEGPKIMGKIELPVKEERKKPVASSSASNTDKDKKKKRKRIRKGFGGATLGDTWDPSQKPGGTGASGASTGSAPGQAKPRFGGGSSTGTSGGGGGYKGRFPRGPKVELTPDQVAAQVKETLARLSGAGKSKASKHRNQNVN